MATWATLSGDEPILSTSLAISAVEDQWADVERAHIGEEVSYVVIGQASGVVAFGGRPETPSLTTINPKIIITRTSGTEPFVVQVSAAGTTTNAGDAYTDLEYSWDFGDLEGTEVFQHPVSGEPENANVDQKGPEAAYVYRHAGTYTITLTVRGRDGTGRVLAASTTTLLQPSLQEIHVRNATKGSFQLTASVDGGAPRTTGPIAYNASPDSIVAALAALPNIGKSNIRTSPHQWVETTGSLLGKQLTLTAITTSLVGSNGLDPTVLIEARNPGSASSQVLVSAWSGPTVYFDSNYDRVSHGTPDGSIEAPFTTMAELKSVMGSQQSLQILLKRGSEFVSETDGIGIVNTDSGPLRVGTYGDPKLPRPIIQAGAMPLGVGSRNPNSVGDIVFEGLDLRGGERAFGIFVNEPTGGLSAMADNVHLLDCSLYSSNTTKGLTPLVQIQAANAVPNVLRRGEAFVFWNCDFDREPLSGSADYQAGLDFDASRWVSVVGGSISGGGAGPKASPLFSHHAYVNVYDNLLFRWVKFEEVEDHILNFAIKLRQVAGSKWTGPISHPDRWL